VVVRGEPVLLKLEAPQSRSRIRVYEILCEREKRLSLTVTLPVQAIVSAGESLFRKRSRQSCQNSI
jgi:hypothetical protein